MAEEAYQPLPLLGQSFREEGQEAADLFFIGLTPIFEWQ